MRNIFFCIFMLVAVSNCRNKYNFYHVDQFKIVNNALTDNEPVRVIYYNSGPYDDQVDEGFYRHAVVISSETGDTVNVLTFPNPELDNLKATNYILIFNDHPIINISESTFESLPEEMKRTIENIDPTKVSWPEYTIVAVDPDYDYTAFINYKTVIGSLTKKNS